MRPRRFHSQVTHTLVRTIEHSDYSSSLAQTKPGNWDFVTLWTVAKSVALYPTVRVGLCRHFNGECCSVDTELDWENDVFVDVWPGVVKRTRLKRERDPLDMDPAPRAKAGPRRARGGVVKVSPLQTTLLVPPARPVRPPRPRPEVAPALHVAPPDDVGSARIRADEDFPEAFSEDDDEVCQIKHCTPCCQEPFFPK